MHTRMLVITICLVAMLVGGMIGFIRKASERSGNVLVIQAKSPR